VLLEAGSAAVAEELALQGTGFAHRDYRGVSPPVTSVSLSPRRLNRRLLLRPEIAATRASESTRHKTNPAAGGQVPTGTSGKTAPKSDGRRRPPPPRMGGLAGPWIRPEEESAPTQVTCIDPAVEARGHGLASRRSPASRRPTASGLRPADLGATRKRIGARDTPCRRWRACGRWPHSGDHSWLGNPSLAASEPAPAGREAERPPLGGPARGRRRPRQRPPGKTIDEVEPRLDEPAREAERQPKAFRAEPVRPAS
jgi:hypothetical protein